jgi:macrodomain Ter protein organizer (MatP/YcbG family)
MCRGVRCVSAAWIKNHLTVTLVKKFHRRKHNRRAINKFFQNQDHYNRLGKSVGIVFTLSFRNKKPQLRVKTIKQEALEETDSDIDSSYNDSDTDSESSYSPVALAC